MLKRLVRELIAGYRRGAPARAQRAALRRLRRRVAGFAPAEAGHADAVAALRGPWEAYVASVSPAAMAASLETCALLLALARARRAARVLDLGSGFSSFVLRSYAQSRAAAGAGDVLAVSVDSSTEWLDRTRAFLEAQRVPAGHLVAWDAFREAPRGPFDLVFHDLGNMAVRAEALAFMLAQVGAGGIVLFDDMHKQGYPARVAQACAQAGFEFCAVPALTTDAFGRFAAVGYRA